MKGWWENRCKRIAPHPPPRLPLERGGIKKVTPYDSLPFKGRVREGMG
jgi:hypothetical protein